MTFEWTKSALGGYPGPQGTTTLTPSQPPKFYSSDITDKTPISDLTAESEEKIVYSLTSVPHDSRRSDSGDAGDELLFEGSALFGLRMHPDDSRESMLDLSMVNIFLSKKWTDFKKLLQSPVLTLYQNAIQTINSNEPISVDMLNSLLPESSITLESLCIMASYFDDIDTSQMLPFRTSKSAYLPSEVELYCTDKSSEPFVQDIVAPHKSVDETGMNTGFEPVSLKSFIQAQTPRFNSQQVAIAMNELEKINTFRTIIKFILANHSDITRFVTIDGVKDTFNYLGIFASSQDVESPDVIRAKGHSRNILVCCRGAASAVNLWGNNMLSESALFLVIKRMRYQDGSFGEFYVEPYWSTDNVTEHHKPYPFGSTTFVEGPRDEGLCRRKCVPTHQTTYLDISGKLSNGHIYYVGRVRDPVNDPQPPAVKISALGLNLSAIPSYNTNSAYDPIKANTYQKAYENKKLLSKIEIHLGI